MRKKWMRTKLLTGRPVQLKYLVLLMASMVVPLVFVVGCLYYLIFNILAEQLGIPESIAYNLFPVIKKINFILLVGVPPLLLLLFAWGVALSHRFAGPLERIEKELEHISNSGNYAKRIHLRKNDDVRPLADSINKLMDKIEGKGK